MIESKKPFHLILINVYLNTINVYLDTTNVYLNNTETRPNKINNWLSKQQKTVIKPDTNLTSYSQQHGFSLIEIMIVTTIISILLSAAIPSFNSTLNKSQLSNVNLELISSLSLARDYAITRGYKTHLCALTAIKPIRCQDTRDFNTSWSKGWMVFADINNNSEYDQDDTVLNISQIPKTINVVFNQRGRLRFFPNGSARSAGFYLCNKNSRDNRHIKLLFSGRARTTRIDNSSQLTTCLSAN